MKNILLFFTFLLMAGFVNSQAKVFTSGNTVIGDNSAYTSPAAKLTIHAPVAGGGKMLEINDGAVGSFAVLEGAGGATRFVPTFQFNGSGVNGVSGQFSARIQPSFDIRTPTLAAMVIDGRLTTGTGAPLANSDVLLVRNFTSNLFKVMANGDSGFGVLTPSAKLHVNGDVIANNITAPSDKRLKKNIEPLKYGLSEILGLKPVTFQYNGKGSIDDTKTVHTGVIAQELQEVLPSFVNKLTLEENRIEFENAQAGITDDKSNVELKHNDYLSINDTGLKYVIINAIKELNDIVVAQSLQIEKLELQLRNSNTASNTFDVNLDGASNSMLMQNEPNPFNNVTKIKYNINKEAQDAKIVFFDNQGKTLKVMEIDHSGLGEINLNASEIPSGTYNYTLLVDGQKIDSKKMVLVK